MYKILKERADILKAASSILIKNDKYRHYYSYLYVNNNGHIVSTNGKICFVIKDIKDLPAPGYYLFQKINNENFLIPVTDEGVSVKEYIPYQDMLDNIKEVVFENIVIENMPKGYLSNCFINMCESLSLDDEPLIIDIDQFKLIPSGYYKIKINRSLGMIDIVAFENENLTVAISALRF